MQYYETRQKEYYDVAHDQSRQSYGQNHQGNGQSQSRPVYGHSPTLNYRSHGGFLDGLFKGKNGQKGQNGLGSFLGQHKSQDANKGHGHGKLLGQHEKKTHETSKGTNGLGMFINSGAKKHKNKNEHMKKKKNKDGHASGNENGSSSGSDSD